MSRLHIAVLVVLAVMVAAQPAVHHHPLFPDSTSEHGLSSRALSCTVCASGTERLELPFEVAEAPLAPATVVLFTDTPRLLDGARATLPSRAPPVA